MKVRGTCLIGLQLLAAIISPASSNAASVPVVVFTGTLTIGGGAMCLQPVCVPQPGMNYNFTSTACAGAAIGTDPIAPTGATCTISGGGFFDSAVFARPP